LKINFFSDSITFQPKQKAKIRKWILAIVASYNFKVKEINFIFCDDEYLLKINLDYLNHNTFTDIITFDNSDKSSKNKNIESDIFISVERVTENAIKFKKIFDDELHRVLIHGVLHLCGLKDKTKKDVETMRNAEEQALKVLAIS
jgi:rRNA maturation RNase YbeY